MVTGPDTAMKPARQSTFRGLRPWLWSAQIAEYQAEKIEREIDVRQYAIVDAVEDLDTPYERDVVNERVGLAIAAVRKAGRAYDVAKDVIVKVTKFFVTIGALLAAPLIALLLGLSSTTWVLALVSAVVASLLFMGALQLFRYLSMPFAFEHWLIPLGIPAVVLYAAAAPDRLWSWQPELFDALSTPWVHNAIAATAWTFGIFVSVYFVARASGRIARMVFRRRLRRMPEHQLVYSLSTFVVRVSNARQVADTKTATMYTVWLEDIAVAFERDWAAATARAFPRGDQGNHARWVHGVIRQSQTTVFDLRHEPPSELALRVSRDLIRIILNPNERAQGDLTPPPMVRRKRRNDILLSLLLTLVAAGVITFAQTWLGLPAYLHDFLIVFSSLLLTLAGQSFPNQDIVDWFDYAQRERDSAV